jgi:hypothetical protein
MTAIFDLLYKKLFFVGITLKFNENLTILLDIDVISYILCIYSYCFGKQIKGAIF